MGDLVERFSEVQKKSVNMRFSVKTTMEIINGSEKLCVTGVTCPKTMLVWTQDVKDRQVLRNGGVNDVL